LAAGAGWTLGARAGSGWAVTGAEAGLDFLIGGLTGFFTCKKVSATYHQDDKALEITNVHWKAYNSFGTQFSYSEI
jgi:hypothetical protein